MKPKEIKKFLETNDNKNTTIKTDGMLNTPPTSLPNKSSSKWEVYSNTILPQETRKTSTMQSNFTPKTTGKRITKKKK